MKIAMGPHLLCRSLRESAGIDNWIEQKGGLVVRGLLGDMRDLVFSLSTSGFFFCILH